MTQDTRFVHLTAATKQLFSCHCARTDWNMCVLSLSATVQLPREWVRPQQGATFLLPQQKSCQCAHCRIKQCSPSGQLNSWATKSCQCAPSRSDHTFGRDKLRVVIYIYIYMCVCVCVCARTRACVLVNSTHITQHLTKLIVAFHSFVKSSRNGVHSCNQTSTINFSSCLLVPSSCVRSAQ